MNRCGSHPIHENLTLYEGLPPQGLSLGTAGREFFFNFLFTDPPRGRPVGGGGIYRTLWIEGEQSHILSEYYDLI